MNFGSAKSNHELFGNMMLHRCYVNLKPALDQSCYGFCKRLSIKEKMIQRPYLLADLQPDLAGLPGNVHTTDVLAVTGSEKRKRSELALAIDRQGINVYDVSLRTHFQELEQADSY